MTSLADQIAKFANPVPEILDPEDDINIETTAKLCEKISDENVIIEQASTLRSRTAPLLEEIDQRYAGKRISRKDLDDYTEEDDDSEADDSHDDDESSDDDESEVSEASENDDIALESFKSQMQDKVKDNRDILGDDNLGSSDEENESEDDEMTTDDDDESEDSGDDMVQKFSNIDVTSEMEKGKAVEAQQEFWSKLCECRIKLQRLLIATNKLPQPETWNAFKQSSDAVYSENLKKGHKSVKALLNHLLDLQTALLSADTEMASLMKDGSSNETSTKNDDEEIPSDSEEEQAETSVQHVKPRKRKNLNDREFDDFLAKRHKSFTPFRNSVIQKWDEKTRLSTGRMTQKSFSAFDQSALKQIEQILQDKNRLIKRTQLKRSIYRVLGKAETEISETKADELDNLMEKKSNESLKDYDPEIFDDDDLYRQLLKEIIESKSVGIDPTILNKQQEIQRIRSKMRRKVDTKASKGRKIRFDTHRKLVNVMAPVVTWTMPDSARDELFRSVFGQCAFSARTQT